MAWQEFLGGHDFDAKLTKRFAEEFDTQHKSKMDGESIFDKVDHQYLSRMPLVYALGIHVGLT